MIHQQRVHRSFAIASITTMLLLLLLLVVVVVVVVLLLVEFECWSNKHLDLQALEVRRHLLERDHLAVIGRRRVLHLLVELGQVSDVGFVYFGGADVTGRGVCVRGRTHGSGRIGMNAQRKWRLT